MSDTSQTVYTDAYLISNGYKLVVGYSHNSKYKMTNEDNIYTSPLPEIYNFDNSMSYHISNFSRIYSDIYCIDTDNHIYTFICIRDDEIKKIKFTVYTTSYSYLKSYKIAKSDTDKTYILTK